MDPFRKFTEHAERSTFFVRILRVAYAKTPRSSAPLEGLPPPCGPLSPPLQLKCKTFVPAQLTRGFLVPEFENLTATKRRVEAWISATGDLSFLLFGFVKRVTFQS